MLKVISLTPQKVFSNEFGDRIRLKDFVIVVNAKIKAQMLLIKS